MSQRHVDVEEQSGHPSGVRCPVCKKTVSDNMGRHINATHGAEKLQQYLDSKRCATPSDYKPCPFCSQLLHRSSLKRHIQKTHPTGDAGSGKKSGPLPVFTSPARVKSAVAAEQAAAIATEGIDNIRSPTKEVMGPPMRTPKKKKQEESTPRENQKQEASRKNSYPMGQIHEAVRAMLNHRGTESYTRDKVRDTCRQEMPQLSELECDLATDVAIAAAREVASLSQYAAAYRNLNPGPEYKDALEQIVTLARGPKIETGYPSFPVLTVPSRPTFSMQPYKPTSTFQPVQRPRLPGRVSSIAHSKDPEIEMEDFGGVPRYTKGENSDLDTLSEYQSDKESNDKSPLSLFIRSLRPDSPPNSFTSGSDVNTNTVSPTPAFIDSELIPGTQPSRAMETPSLEAFQQFDITAEDEEVTQLLKQRSEIEKELERDLLADILNHEEDSQEFSQTY